MKEYRKTGRRCGENRWQLLWACRLVLVVLWGGAPFRQTAALSRVQAAEETEEEDIDPADVKIFGMPRVVFHYTAFGVAIGYILSGVLEMAHFNPPNATILAIAFAVVGYIIGSRLYKKRKAERDRAKADAENSAE